MATLTPQSKSGTSTSKQVLEIGGDYKLLIGSTYNLIIQPESSGTIWSIQSKS